MIYFDTDAFRKLGTTFSNTELPARLRKVIVVSPISAVEVIAQLTTAEAEGVLASIRAMRNWLPIERAGILAWRTDFVAEQVFGVSYKDDTFRHIGNALNACLLAETAADLQEPARELRELLDRARDSQARFDQEFLERFRANPVPREEFPIYFARAIAQEVRATLQEGQESRIVQQLSAYFEYQTAILLRAAANPRYNFSAHRDRILDAEQLRYLANPRLHFLTGDRDFTRLVTCSPQRLRIHVGTHEQLTDRLRAIALMQEVAAQN